MGSGAQDRGDRGFPLSLASHISKPTYCYICTSRVAHGSFLLGEMVRWMSVLIALTD